MRIELTPIGTVTSSRAEVRDDDWDAETAAVTLDSAQFAPDALAGLAQFSHVEVLYFFDRVPVDKIEHGARRPRGNPNWPQIGIFAQRGKNRPNRIGLTVARVLGVDGLTVRLAGFDAIEGTPVLDLKPWMDEFGPRGEQYQPAWASELMRGYWSVQPHSPE